MAYLDTGAMYRAITAAVLRQGVDPDDAAGVAAVARQADLVIGTDPGRPSVLVDGDDVTEVIRGPEVTAAVSAVSAVPAVRALMVAAQREAVARAASGIVVEGRDIGTVVLPDAEVKVYLVADQAVRAQRRSTQDQQRDGMTAPAEVVQSQLSRRDAADSGRTVSPLRPAADAVTVDATWLDVEAVVARILQLLDDAGVRT
jgi:cytidylate kinase